MDAALLVRAALHLTRQTRRWDRRLRLALSLIWLPRALIVGLALGVALAVGSRLRAWLLPAEVALIAGLLTVALALGALAVIWLRPRSAAGRARYFDQRFGLKERVSTALELAGGRLPLPGALAEQQLDDALRAARGVRVERTLPLRVAWGEVVLAVVLGVALAYLLLSDNPRLEARRAQQALDQAIAQQAAALEQAIQQVEANPALSDEEQAALTEALREAQEALQQPDLSQEEAVAALAEAGQALHDLGDGLTDAQAAPYQQAAGELAGSEMTADLAEALRQPDLAQAADAADQLAQDLGAQEMTAAEQQALADRLDSAADRLEAANPALAEKLREAAEALRRGDTQAAQQALEEAADLMRQQQAQLEDSPLAQAAQQAEQQVREGQREVAEVGQEVQQPAGSERVEQQSGEAQSTEAQSAQQQAAQPESAPQSGEAAQVGEQAEAAASADQAAAIPETGESQAAQSGASGEGQAPQGQPEGALSQSAQAGEAQAGAQLGEGQPQGEGSAGAPTGQSEGEGQPASGQGDALGQSSGENAPTAGSGEGGAGADTTQGQPVEGAGEMPSSTTTQGGFEAYNPQYAPSTLGGESQDTVQLANPESAVEGAPVQQGEFAPNPSGEAALTFRQIVSRYQDIVSDALRSGRIPLDQRDVIHDYFSSLNR